jgi:glycosyltransferase involved in cell wall biosynthesis
VMMKVHRNLPMARSSISTVNCGELGVPVNGKAIVLQGAGINVQRGAEEAVEAMRYLEGTKLMIIGSGDVIDILKSMAEEEGIKGKVSFKGKLPYDEMMKYTSCADLALSLDKDTNLNYRFSLPNKLFDYIQAGTPVLASDLPEVSKVINEHGVGWTLNSHDPKMMAAQIKTILDNTIDVTLKTQNCMKAASTLTWENERKVLDEILKQIHE